MTTTTSHTPGPWITYPNGHGGFFLKPKDLYLNVPMAATNGPNAEANARLIAAAPELLTALAFVVEQTNAKNQFAAGRSMSAAHELWRDFMGMARAAVSKATSSEARL